MTFSRVVNDINSWLVEEGNDDRDDLNGGESDK